MIRPVLIELGIFLIPFVAYAVYLIARGRDVLDAASWPLKTVAIIAVIALVMLVASLVVLAHHGAPPDSAYVPAHVENGKLVPGTIGPVQK